MYRAITRRSNLVLKLWALFSYKLRYIASFGLVEMSISSNPKPTIYRNLCEMTGPDTRANFQTKSIIGYCISGFVRVIPILSTFVIACIYLVYWYMDHLTNLIELDWIELNWIAPVLLRSMVCWWRANNFIVKMCDLYIISSPYRVTSICIQLLWDTSVSNYAHTLRHPIIKICTGFRTT